MSFPTKDQAEIVLTSYPYLETWNRNLSRHLQMIHAFQGSSFLLLLQTLSFSKHWSSRSWVCRCNFAGVVLLKGGEGGQSAKDLGTKHIASATEVGYE